MVLLVANYADDNSPFTVAPTTPSVIESLESDATNLLWWIKYNGLKANPDKFHMLLSDADKNISMVVDKFDIPNTSTQKLLGITFDNKLNFKPHVTNLCNKASQK